MYYTQCIEKEDIIPLYSNWLNITESKDDISNHLICWKTLLSGFKEFKNPMLLIKDFQKSSISLLQELNKNDVVEYNGLVFSVKK